MMKAFPHAGAAEDHLDLSWWSPRAGVERRGMREPIVPNLDAETYLLWESRQRDRFELHHGFAVAFAGGTADHDRIAHNLRVALDRLFPEPCRSFGSDFKIRVDAQTFYYPDASVVCAEISGAETLFDSPRVIAEVLSPGTRAYDLIEKRAAYRAVASLDVYAIVHTELRRIEADLRDRSRAWHTSYLDDGAIPLGTGTLSLDEVYARTSLQRA